MKQPDELEVSDSVARITTESIELPVGHDESCQSVEHLTGSTDTSDKGFVPVPTQQFSAKALGAKSDVLDQEKTNWVCSYCAAVFDNCIQFGYHLQEHMREQIIIEKSNARKRKNVDGLTEENIENDSKPNEVHVIIGAEDAQKYNFRRNRKKSRVVLENEEFLSVKSKARSKKSKVVENLSDQLHEIQSPNALINDFDTDDSCSGIQMEDNEASGTVIVVKGNSGVENGVISNSEEYTCDICDKKFNKCMYLYRHIRKHTGEFTCPHCQKVFARKESLQTHNCVALIADGKDKTLEFACPNCDKSFGTKKLLDRHIVKHSSEGKFSSYCEKDGSQESFDADQDVTKQGAFYECEKCKKKFSQKVYLMKHLPIHTGQYKCTICDKTLQSNESLQNHVRICSRVHIIETEGKVLCEVCNKEFTDASVFRKHVYEHTHPHVCQKCGARFRNSMTFGLHACSPETCRGCNKKFKGVKKLEKHLLGPCGSNYAQCNKCLKLFQNEDLLKDHEYADNHEISTEKISNQKKSPLICEFCGSPFATLASLNLHRVLHGEKKFECKECGKKFHRKDLLQEHEAVHKEPSVECQVCHKMFKTKNSLDKHMYIHRGIKRFQCDKCDKKFFQKGNLRQHLERHDTFQRYECYVCQKTFASKAYLRVHQLEHSQGRIHNCDICGRSFTLQHLLKRHQRQFHGNQSYICSYCGLPLKLFYSLKSHLSKKHPHLKDEWNFPDALASMAVVNSEQTSEQSISMITSESKLEIANAEATLEAKTASDSDVLLAVAGLGNEALEKAIAEGKAHVRPGVIPDTIEISLPFGLEGDELTRSIVQHSSQIEESEGDDVNQQQTLKLFELQSTSDDYPVVEENPVGDVSNKLVINAVDDQSEMHVPAEGMIVKLQDENGSEIIINQPNDSAQASEDLSVADEGQVLLYVVADEIENV